MDNVTSDVKEMYEQFPYPARDLNVAGLVEYRNLLALLCRETGLSLDEKRVLDAGCGSGHRLVQAAKANPKTNFIGIDMTESSLNLAKQVATHHQVSNLEFRQANILGDLSDLGQFDLVLCMGVLHHLSNPGDGLKNLVSCMKANSMLVLYLYGALGGQERMRRKDIVTTLMQDRNDYKTGIQLLKEFKFDSFEYGWDLQNTSDETRDGLLVDAYLNINENLYTSQTIHQLIEKSELSSYAIYGITSESAGYLFDVSGNSQQITITANPSEFITGQKSQELFSRLPLLKKIQVIDLLYKPNGYTVIAFKGDADQFVESGTRLHENIVRL